MKVELDHHSSQHCYSSHVGDVFCRLLIFANVRPSIKGIILRTWSHTIAYATSHAHTPPSTSPHSQLLNVLKPLCVHGGAEESHVACNGCGRRRTVYTVSGRELSVCMSVWSMASICMSQVVCWLFLKWYVIHLRCCVSHLLSLSMVMCVDCLVFGRHTVCGIFCR